MIRGVGVGLDSRNAKEFSWNGVVCKEIALLMAMRTTNEFSSLISCG